MNTTIFNLKTLRVIRTSSVQEALRVRVSQRVSLNFSPIYAPSNLRNHFISTGTIIDSQILESDANLIEEQEESTETPSLKEKNSKSSAKDAEAVSKKQPSKEKKTTVEKESSEDNDKESAIGI